MTRRYEDYLFDIVENAKKMKDLTEIQESVKEGLKIVSVEKVEEALPYVFGKK